MNKDNILAVANAIEANVLATRARAKVGFNMARYATTGTKDMTGHACGTVACIAGWTCILGGWSAKRLLNDEDDAFAFARRRFGLSEDAAFTLFIPNNFEDDEITPAAAAAVLRHLAATGTVDWSIAQ